MKKYLPFLIIGILFVLLVGIFLDKKNDFFKGGLVDLNSVKEVEFEPIINISSEIPGFEILPSANFKKTIKVWNKKLAIGEYKKNYNIKIYSSDLVKMDNSLDGVSLANTDKTFSKDGKSILFAFKGTYEINKTDLPTDVSIYISKEYLFDKSIKLSEKKQKINHLIFRAILANSSNRSQNKTLLTETERNTLNELSGSSNLPFEINLDKSYLNENWRGFINKISELFSFEIIGRVYASCAPYGNCADHGTWEDLYTCRYWPSISCSSSGDCYSTPCDYSETVCHRLGAWSNQCAPSGGFACDACCDCVSCTAAETCTTNCGANASVPNGSCGTTACDCKECEDCSLACGQAKDCGGSCGTGSNSTTYGTCTTSCGNNSRSASNPCSDPSSWTDTNCNCVECGPSYSDYTPACGNQTRTCSENCGTDNCAGAVLTNCAECGPYGTIPACGPWTQTYNCKAAVTGCQVCAPTITTFTPVCGSQTRTCTDNDGTCSGTCVGITLANCQHCDPTIPAWSTTWPACDGAHKQFITRPCTENDGSCDDVGGVDDCDVAMANQTDPTVCPAGSNCTYNTVTNVQTRTRDCVGTITGTLFDASDYPSCPGSFTGVPTINGQQFDITSPYTNPPNTTWPPSDTAIIKTLTTSGAGAYSTNAFIPGTYLYNFSALSNMFIDTTPKFRCQGASASFNANECPDDDMPCITKTYDFGFWRIYGGWWQAVGGSVYARSGVRSYVPASLPAANQRLILGDVIGRVGVLAHGYTWTGNELGTNPDVKVSVPNQWRIQSTYEGLRYDYNYYTTRMNIFDSTNWDEMPAISYNGGVNGYQIKKRTGDATLGSLTLSGTQKLIILVDGNLTVTGNVVVPSGAFLAVIAKGNITFNSNPSLTMAQGWFVAENINVPCHDVNVAIPGCDKDDSQFVGEGSFVGWSNISLGRDMNTGNNDNPSEKFVYRPDFVLNAPAPMKLYTKKFAPFIP